MKRVLIVCHGNRYRSPVAAAALVVVAGKQLVVSSAGFRESGLKASKIAREVAEEKHLASLESHRSRRITREMVDQADVVVFMDRGNKERLLGLGTPERKLMALGPFMGPPVDYVPDPGFMPRDAARGVLVQVADAAQNLALAITDAAFALPWSPGGLAGKTRPAPARKAGGPRFPGRSR